MDRDYGLMLPCEACYTSTGEKRRETGMTTYITIHILAFRKDFLHSVGALHYTEHSSGGPKALATGRITCHDYGGKEPPFGCLFLDTMRCR